jgi:hypothetical protein
MSAPAAKALLPSPVIISAFTCVSPSRACAALTISSMACAGTAIAQAAAGRACCSLARAVMPTLLLTAFRALGLEMVILPAQPSTSTLMVSYEAVLVLARALAPAAREACDEHGSVYLYQVRPDTAQA